MSRCGSIPVSAEAGEAFERKSLLKSQGWDLDKLAAYVAKLLEIDVSLIWSTGKYRHIVKARSLLCYWAVRDLGVSMTSLAKRLNLSVAAITQSVKRGERLKDEKSYHFP
jgi:putative transposase